MIFEAGFHSYVVIHSVYFNVKRGEGETLEYKIWILIFYMKLPCFSSNGCFSSTLNFIENLIVYRKIYKESIFIRRAILRFIFSEENDEEKISFGIFGPRCYSANFYPLDLNWFWQFIFTFHSLAGNPRSYEHLLLIEHGSNQ